MKFEYCYKSINKMNDIEMLDLLNAMGQGGWETVGMIPPDQRTWGIMWFKKRVEAKPYRGGI